MSDPRVKRIMDGPGPGTRGAVMVNAVVPSSIKAAVDTIPDEVLYTAKTETASYWIQSRVAVHHISLLTTINMFPYTDLGPVEGPYWFKKKVDLHFYGKHGTAKPEKWVDWINGVGHVLVTGTDVFSSPARNGEDAHHCVVLRVENTHEHLVGFRNELLSSLDHVEYFHGPWKSHCSLAYFKLESDATKFATYLTENGVVGTPIALSGLFLGYNNPTV